jgi:DNA polymerase-1
MSHVYRAYYAIRGLSNSKGFPTNAIFGFTNILRRLINAEKPDYLGVVFDTSDPTFRHEAYEQYKATRSAMPDDLAPQLPYIQRLCDALRVPVTRVPGFEADDVIGTFSKQAEEQGLDVFIVTNDKDLCQLVTDHVFVLRVDRDANITFLDKAGVEGKLGVRPDQVVDLLGLWGDTIDNIPGAPGVGEKGAKQIIQQFGSIEEALARADEISRKTYRESLKNNADLIRKSKELATIKCDVPVALDLEALRYEEPDARAAYELFSELEFTQAMREFAPAASAAALTMGPAQPSEPRAPHDYKLITSRREFDALVKSIWGSDSFAFVPAEREGKLCAVAVSHSTGCACLIDLNRSGETPFAPLREIIENALIRKIVYDWKSCLHLLDRYCKESLPVSNDTQGGLPDCSPAVRIEGVEDDIMLAAYLLDPNRTNYRLGDVAREYLGAGIDEKVDRFDEFDSWRLQAADAIYKLGPILRERIESAGLETVYGEIELPLVEILFEMENLGVRIDTAALGRAGREMETELGRLTAEIYKQAGQEFNINSTVQLADVFEKLNFEVGRKTKTGRISTSSDVLEELAVKYELPRLIIEYREIAKLKSTYVDSLPRLINPRTGRIHTTLNQNVAATGRLSSTNPNLQNIPIRSEMGRRIRAAFVPTEGYVLMSADYSQIELRIFAHITGDPVMTEAFNRGEDIHTRTARAVFGAKTKEQEAELRRLAKIVNFAIAYAVGPFGLAQRTTLSRAEARQAIENYYNTYKGVRRYMEETPEEVRKTGIVRTIFGRIRPIPDINNRNHNLRGRAEREAINAPIQGTAADLVKMAMIRVHGRLKKEKLAARMILQVHDELLLEVPESEGSLTSEIVKEEMESVHKLSVPLVVDIGAGQNWLEAKP